MDRMKMCTGIKDMTFSTSSGRDVKETKMLKGEAKDSLHGKNVTKQDERSGGPKGPFGGKLT
jgi:hypothetical protein